MRILIVGYGKMGKTIERIALSRGHQIAGVIDVHNAGDWAQYSRENADVAIEFTQPTAAVNNVRQCIQAGIPVVCGTTGWLSEKPSIDALCLAKGGALLQATNFSIGVNIFFALNKRLAELMSPYEQYRPKMYETHHTEKKDAPSGTAITLAEGIIEKHQGIEGWHLVNEEDKPKGSLPITAFRVDPAPGTHQVFYESAIDTIEISHTAHSREGFALGAVIAAEWLHDKKGVFTMHDMLGF
jgi:4-hydroxy-tetrahydrodipicolinate reductase